MYPSKRYPKFQKAIRITQKLVLFKIYYVTFDNVAIEGTHQKKLDSF